MSFEASRLRRGEIVAGAAAVLLVVCLLVFSFYGYTGLAQHSAVILGINTTVTGWNALSTLRWLILVTALTALALAFFQGSRPAPALPVTLSVIVTVLGAVTSLGLVYRILIAVPGATGMVSVKFGGYLALISAFALTAGAFMSLREESRPDPVRIAAIPTITVDDR